LLGHSLSDATAADALAFVAVQQFDALGPENRLERSQIIPHHAGGATFKVPKGSYGHGGPLSHLLLAPIQQSSGSAALGGRHTRDHTVPSAWAATVNEIDIFILGVAQTRRSVTG
jgi:hypothetical protein